MKSSDNAGSFTETLQAVASGDEAATNALIAEIIPELLAFAVEHSAQDAPGLVGRVLLDAFRKADHFNGTQSQFVATLCRVIKTLIENESRTDKPLSPTTQMPDTPETQNAADKHVPAGLIKHVPAGLIQPLPDSDGSRRVLKSSRRSKPGVAVPKTTPESAYPSLSSSSDLTPTSPQTKPFAATSTRTPPIKASKPATATPKIKPFAATPAKPFKTTPTKTPPTKAPKPATATPKTKPFATTPTENPPTKTSKPVTAALDQDGNLRTETTSPSVTPLTPSSVTTSDTESSGEEQALPRSRQVFLGVGLLFLALPLLYLLLNSFNDNADGDNTIAQQGQQIVSFPTTTSSGDDASTNSTTSTISGQELPLAGINDAERGLADNDEQNIDASDDEGDDQDTDDRDDDDTPNDEGNDQDGPDDEGDDQDDDDQDDNDEVPLLPAACSVTFYTGSQYSGSQQTYSTSRPSLPIAYRSAQGNCTFSLYTDPGFTGSCTTVLTGSAPNLVAGVSSLQINKSC